MYIKTLSAKRCDWPALLNTGYTSHLTPTIQKKIAILESKSTYSVLTTV